MAVSVLRRFAAVCFALVVFAGTLAAQTSGSAPDYDAWGTYASRVEAAVDAGRASDSVLENLRAELTDWSAAFTEAKDANARLIASVQAQLNALGPEPAEDAAPEPDALAAQRASLKERLAELEAPGKRADVAKSRASVLIDEIDSILAARQADALLERGPTPLNPANWPQALDAVSSYWASAKGEISAGWANRNQRAAFQENLPSIMLLIVVSIVFFALGARWINAASRRFVRNRTTARGWLIAFVLSALQLVVALVGLSGLGVAVYTTELIGLRLTPMMEAVMQGGLFFIVLAWLSGFIFAKDDRSFRSYALSDEQNAKGRRAVIGLGAAYGLSFVVTEMARYDSWSPATRAAVFLPLIIVTGYFLWRLGRLLNTHAKAAQAELEEGELPRYIDRLYGLMGRALTLIAFAAPLLVAAGYFNAGAALIFQSVETVILIAFIILAQRALAELWVFLRKGLEEARDGLVPTLLGFVLMLVAVPEFLRIWGMSDARIQGFWQQARDGFSIGETRITAGAFLTFALVFVFGYTLTRLLQGALKTTVLPKTKMDQGGQNALVSGVGYIGIFLAALIAITSAGIDLSGLAIVAGALSVGIGFGMQNIVSNFVSGIILLIERPISEGDWIEVGGTHGTVRDISVRSTRIETFDRSDVILPNSDLISGKVTNYTRGNTVGRVIVPVGVAYGNDTRRVEQILLGIAEAHPLVLAKPAPYVAFQGFGADSLDFEIRAVLRDVNFVLSVRSEMNHEIARLFKEEGIEIPFAQRDIWLRNPEALVQGTPAPETPPEDKADTGSAARDADRRALLHDDDFDMGGSADTGAEDGDGR